MAILKSSAYLNLSNNCENFQKDAVLRLQNSEAH